MFCECPRLVAQLHQAKEISLTDELDAFDSGECACARGREAVVDHRLHSLSRFRNFEVHYIGRMRRTRWRGSLPSGLGLIQKLGTQERKRDRCRHVTVTSRAP